MKRNYFIEMDLRRDQLRVIGEKCEIAQKEKDIIRKAADDVFDELMKFYEEKYGDDVFDFLMDIMTDYLNTKEIRMALLYQDILLCKAGFNSEAASLMKLLGEYAIIADVYFKQMTAKAIIYHDYLIEEPEEESEEEDPFMDAFGDLRAHLEEAETAEEEVNEPCEGNYDENSFYADSFGEPNSAKAEEGVDNE